MSNDNGATAMRGLEGMAVMAVSERDPKLEYAIETRLRLGGVRCAERGPGCITAVRPGFGICPSGPGQ